MITTTQPTASRNVVARTTEYFLSKVVTPQRSYVGMLDGTPLEDTLKYVTGAIGPVLPMTFTIYSQSINTPSDEELIQLILLINPDSVNHGKVNSVQASYTRQGYVIQPWGPNQETLSATGKTAAFMVTDRGLTNLAQQSTIAFHNLMALVALYRNNGYQYEDPLISKDTQLRTNLNRVISVIRGVRMTYDGDSFLGHFNTFTLDQDAASPFLMGINFEFICSTLSNASESEIRGHYLPMDHSKYNTTLLVKDFQNVPTTNVTPTTGFEDLNFGNIT